MSVLADPQFVYGVDCAGNQSSPGRIGSRQSIANYAHQLLLSGGTAGVDFNFPCQSAGALELDGLQVALRAGYVGGAGVDVSRKVFVPAAGGFARYLEVLTNRAPWDVTVRVRVSGWFDGAAVQPATAVSVVADDASGTRPSMGFVFGGEVGQPVVTATTDFQSGTTRT